MWPRGYTLFPSSQSRHRLHPQQSSRTSRRSSGRRKNPPHRRADELRGVTETKRLLSVCFPKITIFAEQKIMYYAHLHLQHRPLQPRPLPRGLRQEVSVARYRRHQRPPREGGGGHAAVPRRAGAAGAQGRGGAPHPRQGTRTGLPRGLRQIPVVGERAGTGALPAGPLQDAGLRRQRGLFRQREPHRRWHWDEGGQHPQLRGGYPHRRTRAGATGDAAVR